MRRLSGFSLMEMMVVLLIVAIIAAASAPMVNKKLLQNAADNGSPWVWLGTSNSIAYNLGNKDQTAIIGDTAAPNVSNPPKMYIKSSNGPQISLSNEDATNLMNITSNNDSIKISTDTSDSGKNSVIIGANSKSSQINSVAIGYDSEIKGSSGVAVGYNTTASGNSVVIGSDVTAEQNAGIAIGRYSYTSGSNAIAIGGGSSETDRTQAGGKTSIAIGYKAQTNTTATDSIAIGSGAKAVNTNSVAIGPGAKTSLNNQIVLGSNGENGYPKTQSIVFNTNSIAMASDLYVKGKLVVCGDVELATDTTSKIKVRSRQGHSGEGNTTFNYFVKGSYFTSGNTFTPSITSSSTIWGGCDRRLKNVGKAFEGGLAEIKKLEVFHFTYKKDETKTPQVGVMAQDLQKIFPTAVFKGDDGFLRIRWDEMFYALINSIKELDTMITNLKNQEIAVLQQEVKELKKQNADLEKRLEKLEKKIK